MSRLPLLLPALVLAVAVGGFAQQPKEPPKETPATKEPTHDGKPLSEWVKLLGSEDEGAQRKATEAIRHISDQSDRLAEKLLDMALDPKWGGHGPSDALVTLGPKAVPALTAALASSTGDTVADHRTRQLCARVLTSIGEDARPAIPVLTRVLQGPDDGLGVRGTAAHALGMTGAHPAIPTLAKCLTDPDKSLRFAAANALASLGVEPGVVLPTLMAGLESKGDQFPSGAVFSLGKLGPAAAPAVPALATLLPNTRPGDASLVCRALGQIGPGAKEAVASIKARKAAMEKEDVVRVRQFRRDAAVALWLIGRDPDAAKFVRENLDAPRPPRRYGVSNPELLWRIDQGTDTVAALERMLNSDNPEQVVGAAGVLGARAKDAVPLLGKMLAHQSPYIRGTAVVALVRLGPAAKDALEALRATTKDDVPEVAFWAAVAAGRLDPKPEAVAAVAGYLGDRDPVLRRDAAEVLGLLGAAGKPAVPTLTAAQTDPEEDVRLAAAVALWRIDHHPTTIASVVELLRSTDRRVREQAALELGGTFGDAAKPAVPDLVKRLFDTSSAVRSVAAEAIGRVGPGARAAAPALLAVLDADEPGYVQSAACEALGLIDPADKDAAAAVLKRKLDHPDPLTRVHAALALYLLTGDTAGEKEAERLLGYRTHQVRVTAAEALWRMKQDGRAVPLLVRALEESNLDGTESDNERYMAARALGRIGAAAKPAVPELVKLLTHHDAMLAATAAKALKAIDPETAKKAGVK